MRKNTAVLFHLLMVLFIFQNCGQAFSPTVDDSNAEQGSSTRKQVRLSDMVLQSNKFYSIPKRRRIGTSAATNFKGYLSTPWTNGILPVEFTAEIPQDLRNMFMLMCRKWQEKTGVRCISRQSERTFLSVSSVQGGVSGSGCWADVGMGPKTRINLDLKVCWEPQFVLHEIGHALGLMHEIQRPDRDQFVTVNYDKLPQAQHEQFNILAGTQYLSPYDLNSIMSYGLNEKLWWEPKEAYRNPPPTPLTRISELDALSIRTLYRTQAEAIPLSPEQKDIIILAPDDRSAALNSYQWGYFFSAVLGTPPPPGSRYGMTEETSGSLLMSGEEWFARLSQHGAIKLIPHSESHFQRLDSARLTTTRLQDQARSLVQRTNRTDQNHALEVGNQNLENANTAYTKIYSDKDAGQTLDPLKVELCLQQYTKAEISFNLVITALTEPPPSMNPSPQISGMRYAGRFENEDYFELYGEHFQKDPIIFLECSEIGVVPGTLSIYQTETRINFKGPPIPLPATCQFQVINGDLKSNLHPASVEALP